MNESLPAEYEALILAALSKRVTERAGLAKAMFSMSYREGDKRTFRWPPRDGAKLGTVYREDSDPHWVVADPDLLSEHLATPDSDAWEPVVELLLPSGDVARMHPDDELYRVVRDGAPHLTRDAGRRLRDGIVADLLAESSRTGEAVAPGIARVKPAGRLVVRSSSNAAAVVEAMQQAGVIAWDGRPVLQAAVEAS